MGSDANGLKCVTDCTYNYEDCRASRQTLHDKVFLSVGEWVIDTCCPNRNVFIINIDLPGLQLYFLWKDRQLRASGGGGFLPLDKCVEKIIHFIVSFARLLQWLWFFRRLLLWALSAGQTRRHDRLQRPLAGRILRLISDRLFRPGQENSILGSELANPSNSIVLSPEDSRIAGSGDPIIWSGPAFKRKNVRELSEQYYRRERLEGFE